MPIPSVVEGHVDEAVVRRLLRHVGKAAGSIYGRNGKDWIHGHVAKYNQAAQFSSWLILVDLNDEARCAPELLASWLPTPSRGMVLRVAVREIEAWLMADRASFARFLRIPLGRVPADPESVPHPKERVVELARRSRSAAIRRDLVPREGSGVVVGPGYNAQLVKFASQHWDPAAAAGRSDSLRRALQRLAEIEEQG